MTTKLARVSMPSLQVSAKAARALGPWKYSCTQGSSTLSMSAIVPVTSTFFSAMHRDAVAGRVQRIEIVGDKEHRQMQGLAAG